MPGPGGRARSGPIAMTAEAPTVFLPDRGRPSPLPAQRENNHAILCECAIVPIVTGETRVSAAPLLTGRGETECDQTLAPGG
jgi:hypothetical protein